MTWSSIRMNVVLHCTWKRYAPGKDIKDIDVNAHGDNDFSSSTLKELVVLIFEFISARTRGSRMESPLQESA